MRHTAICCLWVLMLAPPARAADVWSLMSGDLGTTAVTLKAIDGGGLRVANVDGSNERAVPMAEFVELERPAPAAPAAGKFVLYLTTGDRLAGEPAGVKGESIVWRNPTLGELPVPLRQLRALAKAGVKVGADDRRKEDVVTLTNRDVVRGSIADLSATKVTLQTDAGQAEIPLDSIESLGFAAAAQTGNANKVGYRLRLADGSSVVGDAIATDGDKAKLTLGGAARTVDLAGVTGIEQVNGPVSWLSSRAPAESVYVPYLGTGQRYPARMNANAVGDPIRFKDRIYARGIGVHSYSRLAFPLDGKTYTAFRTRYAIDPSADTDRADVTVRVKLDDKVVHEQAHVRPGAMSPVVVADLGDAKTLTLEVDYGDYIDSGDRLNWIEPALMKVKPAAEPAPAAAPATGPATAPASAPATLPASLPPAR